MNIPDCYEAFRQAEQIAAMRDKLESQMERCGGCGRILEPGQHLWTVPLEAKPCLICENCKEDMDESETIAEEADGYV